MHSTVHSMAMMYMPPVGATKGSAPRELVDGSEPHTVGCGGTSFVERAGQRDGSWHRRLDNSVGNERRWAYPEMVARRPCMMFWANMFCVVVLIMFVGIFEWAELTENSDFDWTIADEKASEMVDAIELAEIEVGKASSAGAASKERENLAER